MGQNRGRQYFFTILFHCSMISLQRHFNHPQSDCSQSKIFISHTPMGMSWSMWGNNALETEPKKRGHQKELCHWCLDCGFWFLRLIFSCCKQICFSSSENPVSEVPKATLTLQALVFISDLLVRSNFFCIAVHIVLNVAYI